MKTDPGRVLPYLFVPALAVGMLLSACDKRAEVTSQPNSNFVVETLFTHEGCTVSRFYDGGRAHYFTDCKGSTSQYQSCGKNCTYLDGVAGGAK